MSEGAAVTQSTYELLRGRLLAGAKELSSRAERLNQERLSAFGSSSLELLGTERIRTESAATPRDIATVGDQMIVAYNPVAGVTGETRTSDVFAVHHVHRPAGGGLPEFSPNPEGLAGSALDDEQFQRDVDELHTYFKESRLQQLYRNEQRLLAVFRTGAERSDLRVLRWQAEPGAPLRYLDARGDRDHRFPTRHDVAWTLATRADHVGTTHIAIDDRVLVDPLGGSLDIRLDDGGAGTLLLQDPLDHPDQSLQDCQLRWARAGDLVLLDLLPYAETNHRFYVVNLLVHSAIRLDSLGQAFRQLPDGQGLIFPEGVYLRTGELRTFDLDVADMELLEVVRSPNGEDMLYVFYEQEAGRSILLAYNVVRQEVTTPMWCHGHSFFDDGTMVLFREETEPTRIHPIQVWSTPFSSDEWYEAQPRQSTPLDRIGNPSLVAGIADALGVARLVEGVEPSTELYSDLLASVGRFLDTHHWLDAAEVGDLAAPAHDIRMVAEQVIDEFERTLEVQAAADNALAEAERDTAGILDELRLRPPTTTEAFIETLAGLRRTIGHLHTVGERRQIDGERVAELIAETETAHNDVAQAAAAHLSGDGAFEPFHVELAQIEAEVPDAESSLVATALVERVDTQAQAMDLVAGTVGDLVVEDPRVRTSVLEQVAGVLADVNRVRALAVGRRDGLIQSETGAAFATELGLFGQSIAAAVGRTATAEDCDDALARLLLQLEQIETSGPRSDAQLNEVALRRDEVTEALTARRQQLVDERQQRAERLVVAAERSLARVVERAGNLTSIDDVHGFFAADPMVARVRALVEDLRELGEPVKADELQARVGAGREQATRALRDRLELFDGDAIKLGRHRFSVDARPRQLTVVPSGETLDAVLTGTDLRFALDAPELDVHRDLWEQPLPSETPQLYRAAFLAGDLLARLRNAGEQIPEDLETLTTIVRADVDRRLDEGYDRGVHDVDAAALMAVIGPTVAAAGTLVTPGPIRAAAQLAWSQRLGDKDRERWIGRGVAAAALDVDAATHERMAMELGAELGENGHEFDDVARYLIAELVQDGGLRFAISTDAHGLIETFSNDDEMVGVVERMQTDLAGAVPVLSNHLQRALPRSQRHILDEVVVGLLAPELPRRVIDVDVRFRVDGLLGRHPTITDGVLEGSVDGFMQAATTHAATSMRQHRDFSSARRSVLGEVSRRLRLDDLEPRVPEGFVRNQLIDQVYLPLIGDNLARQIGTVDDQSSARSGLLMLLSPPGYGKTTLVEYVADRLGMAMVKVSGPGLGHEVTSLDPAQAPSATAAREIERINLAFALGSNVILYLDDIQHTNPEFLQRFISLCDGQRRIEGVWDGEARTFDLRGKRFAVVMAGNPYTESGERFRVPDMLANRADTYNLGDVLTGNEGVFSRSYLENALTSNPVLAPLADRDPADLEQFFRAAEGQPLTESSLSHDYSTAELNEIIATVGHLLQVQRVVLSVNREYIASASTDDQYRTEPPFLLQGSYRNMARMVSKLLPVMTTDEVDLVIDEHYAAESQALTGAAEWNLLKLAELRSSLDAEQAARRDEIRSVFARRQRLGGDDRDPATRVVAAIEQVADALRPRSGGLS